MVAFEAKRSRILHSLSSPGSLFRRRQSNPTGEFARSLDVVPIRPINFFQHTCSIILLRTGGGKSGAVSIRITILAEFPSPRDGGHLQLLSLVDSDNAYSRN